MKGTRLKALLVSHGVQQKELAKILGIKKQTLSAALDSDDVRSSLVEGVATTLGVPISAIYGEDSPSASAGNGGTAIAGSGNHLNTQVDKFLDLLKEKDVQLARSQGEIDKLLDIVGKKVK